MLSCFDAFLGRQGRGQECTMPVECRAGLECVADAEAAPCGVCVEIEEEEKDDPPAWVYRYRGDRWMHKVRLNPTVAQIRRWNTADLDELQNPPSDHVFARMMPDSVARILRGMQPWMSITEYRNEQVQRATLWRYLTGDRTYDVDHYLTRLERRAALVDA